MKKIAVVGPESTGKSALCEALARHFGGVCVPEYAREYLNALHRPYEQTDLLRIARGQLALEQAAVDSGASWIFCDTHLLVIQVWSEYKYGNCDPQLLEWFHPDDYAFHLLTDIDLLWEDDPLREHPHARGELFDIYMHKLENLRVPFGVVSGEGESRLQCALEVLHQAGI